MQDRSRVQGFEGAPSTCDSQPTSTCFLWPCPFYRRHGTLLKSSRSHFCSAADLGPPASMILSGTNCSSVVGQPSSLASRGGSSMHAVRSATQLLRDPVFRSFTSAIIAPRSRGFAVARAKTPAADGRDAKNDVAAAKACHIGLNTRACSPEAAASFTGRVPGLAASSPFSCTLYEEQLTKPQLEF